MPRLLSTAFLLALATLTFAADPATAPATKPAPKPKHVAITDPDKAGPDFAIQGEYLGENPAGGKLAAQVIALGDGKFAAVLLPGGLPGDGWDGKTRVELAGKTAGDATTFTARQLPSAAGLTIKADAVTANLTLADTYSLKRVSRQSPTLGAKPPANATVLFDGTSTDAFATGKMDDRKLLAALPAGVRTKAAFASFTMHIEFLTPYMPTATGQERGNSGVYLQDRYEIQVLDSFGLKGADNECGGIYKNAAPKTNMCFPPLTWQTYDIDFTAATFKDGVKTKNATLTVKHNGVTIHENLEIKAPTGGGKLKEDPTPGPLFLQNHNNPVFYRNIWLVPK